MLVKLTQISFNRPIAIRTEDIVGIEEHPGEDSGWTTVAFVAGGKIHTRDVSESLDEIMALCGDG